SGRGHPRRDSFAFLLDLLLSGIAQSMSLHRVSGILFYRVCYTRIYPNGPIIYKRSSRYNNQQSCSGRENSCLSPDTSNTATRRSSLWDWIDWIVSSLYQNIFPKG